jgi:CYTH domain-containing protein
MEIERKWLVNPKSIEELKGLAFECEKVEQYYLNDKTDSWVIRLRKANNQYFMTLKNKGLLSREEIEVKISKKLYYEAVQNAKTFITKTRYRLEVDPYKALCYEIDVYDDYTFITCEVEFDSEEEANNFVAPSWCIADVTLDPSYKNVNLARNY